MLDAPSTKRQNTEVLTGNKAVFIPQFVTSAQPCAKTADSLEHPKVQANIETLETFQGEPQSRDAGCDA